MMWNPPIFIFEKSYNLQTWVLYMTQDIHTPHNYTYIHLYTIQHIQIVQSDSNLDNKET